MGSVRDVYDGLVTEVTAALGSEFTQLQRFLELIEENTSRNIVKGFGIIPGQAVSAPGILKFITLYQTFTIVLTEKNTRETTDEKRVDTLLDTLYDKADDVHDKILNTQIGLPATVLTVSQPSIQDPEYLDSFIVLRLGVVVKYRRQLP